MIDLKSRVQFHFIISTPAYVKVNSTSNPVEYCKVKIPAFAGMKSLVRLYIILSN